MLSNEDYFCFIVFRHGALFANVSHLFEVKISFSLKKNHICICSRRTKNFMVGIFIDPNNFGIKYTLIFLY